MSPGCTTCSWCSRTGAERERPGESRGALDRDRARGREGEDNAGGSPAKDGRLALLSLPRLGTLGGQGGEGEGEGEGGTHLDLGCAN